MAEEEEKERIVIPDEDGNEHLFDILFTFDADESEQSYIVVVPSSDADNEEVEVFAFRYEEEGEGDESDINLFPIESDEEWEMVEEMVNTYSANEME
ncbi:DUF1292 domain-containing protein [Marinococcus halophilus]|uniref:DUF1292 domain-containing protein n=1 Tax=Marinococcus halophilus TaxID=1371 RepID=UPI0009A8D370|nr:DUF1292 domain-containing protein [Marinococcus halophilus]